MVELSFTSFLDDLILVIVVILVGDYLQTITQIMEETVSIWGDLDDNRSSLEYVTAKDTADRATSDENAAILNRNSATSDRNSATLDRNSATSDRNSATSDRNSATPEKNSASSDRNSATSDRNSATSDRNSTTFDRNSATPDRNPATSTTAKSTNTIPTFEDLKDQYASTILTRHLDLIRLPDSTEDMSRVYYEVNGSAFVTRDMFTTQHNETIVPYELYKVAKENEEGSEDEDVTTELEVTTQNLPQGLVINSNVFLTDAQWHTMALVGGDLFRCAVCQMYCDRADCLVHIELPNHLRKLDQHKPLKRFDLSIVRKINENLHCGVCNDIFDMIDYITHENSKNHEQNLLTAINKVSDLMYDANIHENFFTSRRFHYTDRIIDTERSVRTPERSVQTSDNFRNNNNAYHFDANEFNNDEISVYEEFGDENEDDEMDEYLYEGEEFTTPFEGVSYASMARKPRIELPKFLKIDLGTKEVRVKFESWHMIVKTEPNKFYCMVCNEHGLIRYKSKHCISCTHLEGLTKCNVVGAFEDYLIRKVDDKLYHCGHCNNLQYQNQMNEHIESMHPKKNTNIIDTTPNIKNVDKKNKIKPKTNSENQREVIVQKNLESRLNSKVDIAFDIFDEVKLSPFGCELRIPALTFNFIMIRDGEYYCAVCDKTCADVKGHVEQSEHMELMTMTPFIRPFKNHLTRAVRGTLHCSLCNKLLQVADIYNHNLDQLHIDALAIAMGMKKTQKPTTNYKVDFKNGDTDKLATPLLSVISKHINSQAQTPSNILKISDNNVASKTPPMASPNTHKSIGETQNMQKLGNGINFYINPQANLNFRPPVSLNQTTQIGQYYPKTPNPGFPSQNYPLPPNPELPGYHSSFTSQNQQELSQNQHGLSQNQHGPSQNQHGPSQNQHGPSQNPKQNLPSMYNQFFPKLPNVNDQELKAKFLGAPLSYNYNGTRTPYPLQLPSETAQNQLNPKLNQTELNDQNIIETQKKIKNVVNNPNSIRTGNNIKTGNDIIKTGNDIGSGNEIIKPSNEVKVGDDSFESVNVSMGSENVETQTEEDEIKEFDEEELVFLKLKTTYFKISNISYNTLVYLDNDVRQCFVCSNSVRVPFLQQHVESRGHAENIAKNKFLDKYGVQLFRQMYLMYHCAICNVLMTRKEIKLHLDWPVHIENYDIAHRIFNKKNRKELKSGIKEYVVETQKEAIFNNVNEPKFNLIAAYQIVANMEVNKDAIETKPAKGSNPTAVKKNKMIIFNNLVMKVSFDHWHGITSSKNVTKCIICQVEIRQDEKLEHVVTEYHNVALGKTFEKIYYPALVRIINENTTNCVVCNLELPNNESMVFEHTNGRKHNKNEETIVKEGSISDSYADCYEDYLNL